MSTDREILLDLLRWHMQAMTIIDILQEHADKPMDFGTEEKIQLKPEELRPFRLGLFLAKIQFDSLPFTIVSEAEDESERI